MSKRTVQRELIKEWLREKYPDGILKLANRCVELGCRVPVSSIEKIRSGRVPRNEGQRRALAKAIGTTENKLFPLVDGGEEQAS